ncbi:MAG: hypothetical protein WBN15_04885 [Polyangiales bacterium]
MELNAIVEQMLERFSRVLGALVEERAEVTNTRDDVLGSRGVKRLERRAELFDVALLPIRQCFELPDLFEDATWRRAGGCEVDEVVDLGLSRGERLLGLGSLTGNGSLRACEFGLRGLHQMRHDLGSVEVSEHRRRKGFSKSRFHHGARVLATAAVAAARITSVARLLRLLDDHRAAANAAANEGGQRVDPPGGTRSAFPGVG